MMTNLEQKTQETLFQPRSFTIGPLAENEARFIDEYYLENLAKVQAGTRYEDGLKINIKTQVVLAPVDHLIQEILAYTQRHLQNGGITRTQVEKSIHRLKDSGKADELGEEVGHELVNAIYSETIHRIIFEVRMPLEEVFINHYEHGNKDPHKQFGGQYVIDETGLLRIESWDAGEGFNPEDVPSPLEAMALDKPFGRGLLLENEYMDTVDYQSNGPQQKLGTSVLMTKRLSDFDQWTRNDDESDEEVLAIDFYTKRGINSFLNEQDLQARDGKKKELEKAQRHKLDQSVFKWRLRLSNLLSGKWTIREAIAGKPLISED